MYQLLIKDKFNKNVDDDLKLFADYCMFWHRR